MKASVSDKAMMFNFDLLVFLVLKSQWGVISKKKWRMRFKGRPIYGLGTNLAIEAPIRACEASSMWLG